MRIASALFLTLALLGGCTWRDAGIDPVRWASEIARSGCEAARHCGTVDDRERRAEYRR